MKIVERYGDVLVDGIKVGTYSPVAGFRPDRRRLPFVLDPGRSVTQSLHPWEPIRDWLAETIKKNGGVVPPPEGR